MSNNEQDIIDFLKEALKQWQHCARAAYYAPANYQPHLLRIQAIREHLVRLGVTV